MKTILVQPSPFDAAFKSAEPGTVFTLLVHELKYPESVRLNPPRIRLLERYKKGHVRCELLDDWPDAPDYWPPEWAPGFVPGPASFWQGPVPDR